MQKYEPIGLKTMDGKEIMTYTKEYYFTYVKERMEKTAEIYEQMLIDEAREKEIKRQERKRRKQIADNNKTPRFMYVYEDEEPYVRIVSINKKHDKLFKELLSNKTEAVNFLKVHLNLDLTENDIEKYEKEFRTSVFGSIEADIVYKMKDRDYFILIEHQSTIDEKMVYRILNYKVAIINSAIDLKRMKDKDYKIPKVLAVVLYTGNKKWNPKELKDIEEKLENFIEPKGGYKLIDVNNFNREELIEDELITSKAMLIESSKGQEELYKNINDIIDNQRKNKGNNDEESKQLEDLIKYELIGTKNENMIKEFIEKIKNEKGGKETMTNASKIINREMRKRESKGRAEGIAMMARKLKNKMSIEEIKELTGLSEEKIQSL
mgnify:FL=1